MKFKFEYRITSIYLVVGALWILFSDRALIYFADNTTLISQLQTYKGWFMF